MKLGLTGTREGITQSQLLWVTNVFDNLQISVLHHGCCVGADASGHELAVARNIPVIVHPPVKTRFIASQCLDAKGGLVTVLPAKPYLNRDRDIVVLTDGLVALPKNHEPPSYELEGIGGTWYTVRFAVRMNKPVMICYPDGQVEKREQMRKA